MHLKIIPAICVPNFVVYFVRIRLSQLVTTPSSGQNLPQIVTHILQKAFFKHALERVRRPAGNNPCRSSKLYPRNSNGLLPVCFLKILLKYSIISSLNFYLNNFFSNIEINEESTDVHFIFEGTGFLRYQVRMMTGTLIAVGQHKIDIDDVQRMLDAKDKSACRYNAPSCGLYLVEVKYNETN